MGLINDLISKIAGRSSFDHVSSEYSSVYLDKVVAGAARSPSIRALDGMNTYSGGYTDTVFDRGTTESHGILLDTDVDQAVYSMKYFNRWKMPMPDEALAHARGMVFITRPYLNIVGMNGRVNSNMMDNILQGMATTHPDILRMLSADTCPEYGPFFPILTNTCQGFDVPDVTLKTQEFGETFRGWKASYGRHTVDSRTLYTFSLSFDDNRDGTVYNLFRGWVQYIESINYGLIAPKEKHSADRIIDYMVSVYTMVLAEDAETILYFGKDTGVMPTSIPSSAYSMDKDGSRGPMKLSVQFSANTHEEMNPAILADFNASEKIVSAGADLTGAGGAIHSNDENNGYLGGIGSTWKGSPYVEFDGRERKFKLKWKGVNVR